MSPTIVLKDGKPFLVTARPAAAASPCGAAGDLECDRPQAADHRRGRGAALHHQWMPDQVLVERSSPATRCAHTAGARPYRGGQPTADVDEFDPGHAGGFGRRRRSALARRWRRDSLASACPGTVGSGFPIRTCAEQDLPHFNDALLATSAHFAISLLRKASSFSGDRRHSDSRALRISPSRRAWPGSVPRRH